MSSTFEMSTEAAVRGQTAAIPASHKEEQTATEAFASKADDASRPQ